MHSLLKRSIKPKSVLKAVEPSSIARRNRYQFQSASPILTKVSNKTLSKPNLRSFQNGITLQNITPSITEYEEKPSAAAYVAGIVSVLPFAVPPVLDLIPVTRAIDNDFFITDSLLTDMLPLVSSMQVTYASTMLAFIGSVHWGLAIANYKRPIHMEADTPQGRETADMVERIKSHSSDKDNLLRYIFGTSCLFLGAIIKLTSPAVTVSYLLLSASFVGLLLIERKLHQRKLVPSWYLRMRGRLTIIIVLALLFSMFRFDYEMMSWQ